MVTLPALSQGACPNTRFMAASTVRVSPSVRRQPLRLASWPPMLRSTMKGCWPSGGYGMTASMTTLAGVVPTHTLGASGSCASCVGGRHQQRSAATEGAAAWCSLAGCDEGASSLRNTGTSYSAAKGQASVHSRRLAPSAVLAPVATGAQAAARPAPTASGASGCARPWLGVAALRSGPGSGLASAPRLRWEQGARQRECWRLHRLAT